MSRKLAYMGFRETSWKPSADYRNCYLIASRPPKTTLRDLTGTDYICIIHKWRLSYNKLSKSWKELKVQLTGYYKLRNTIHLSTTQKKTLQTNK
jgi:hypothetical protein